MTSPKKTPTIFAVTSKIINIVAPTTTWFATYEHKEDETKKAKSNDDEPPSVLPVAIWALLADQRVVGFVASPYGGGALVSAETLPGEFLGYVDEAELMAGEDDEDE